SHGSHETDEEF
nr:RecName: Full=Cytochrome c oxidase subunit 5A, mitochondrial; AltName: Full=Cytochrome c oxidase polypeptide Va [Canis lupus familiaris]